MGLFKKIRNKRIAERNKLLNEIQELQENKKEIIRERKNLVKELKEKRGTGKNHKTGLLSSSSPLPRFPFCPIMQRNIDLEYRQDDDQPWGLSKGSIRACFATWMFFSSAILIFYVIFSAKFPIQLQFQLIMLWFGLTGIVIGYYFLYRWRMGMGGLFKFF